MSLVSLANILHHTGYSKDASVAVEASLHIINDKRISFFTLGNIFAVSLYSIFGVCQRDPDLPRLKEKHEIILMY